MEADLKAGVESIVARPATVTVEGPRSFLQDPGMDTLEENHFPAVTGLKSSQEIVESNENARRSKGLRGRRLANSSVRIAHRSCPWCDGVDRIRKEQFPTAEVPEE
ncbi:MAG: hypothetical protein JRJ26_20055 [Deltaproteobacteria bacterium]|nr:hypothetical protein [Deltaproteobacteria bacterium]